MTTSERKRATNKAWRESHREYLLAEKRRYYVAHRELYLARAKARFDADPVEAASRGRAQYRKHAAKRRASKKAYYGARRDDIKVLSKAFRHEHADTLRARRKAYCLANPDRVRAQKRADEVKHVAARRERRRLYYQSHHSAMLARWNRWAKAHPEKVNAIVARRKAAKLQATPMWASAAAIEAIYREAARLTKETGIAHAVDHYYPLISPLVCGLHVEHNLRVITKSDNSRKGNRLPVAAAA